jgi:hypothetical protein
MQHAATRNTLQRRPLFTPLPARAVSWPPLDTACAPSLAYKRPPFFPEKIHTIPSTSPDILLSLLSLPIELAGAGQAPRAPRVPGDSDAAPTYRRSRAAEKDPHSRRDTSPSPMTAAGEHPQPPPPSRLPLALALHRARKEAPITIRCFKY